MSIERILIVGAGNMGGAMLDGWLASGLDPARFTILSPNRGHAPDGVSIVRDAPSEGFDAVVLGFKPYMLADISPSLQDVTSGASVISVLAGPELGTLRAHFPAARHCVRLMPNLACALGKSPLPVIADGDADRGYFAELLDALGTAEWLADENQFDLLTALTGCGPGFVYRWIDAMAQGASRLGLDPAQAERLAVATVDGAASLAAASEHAPGELARRVASPGGMTQAGLNRLDQNEDLVRLVTETLHAAQQRGAQMAEESKK